MANIKIEDEFELAKIIDKVKADCSPNRSFAYAYTEHLKINDKPVNIYSDGEKIFIIPTDYNQLKLYMPIQKIEKDKDNE